MKSSTEELAFLGPSVCLYFSMVKYILAFMCIPLVAALICAGINYNEDDYRSIPHKIGSDSLLLQQCIHIGVWVIAAVYYPFSFLRFLKNSTSLLVRKPTAADYTVKVSGIEYLGDPQTLRRYMQNLLEEKYGIRPEIDGVFPAYNIGSLGAIQTELKFWETNLKKIENGTYRPTVRSCRKLRMATQDICEIQIDYYKQLKNRVFQDIHEEEAAVAFVAFKYPYDARRFVDSFSVPFFIQLNRYFWDKVCCKKKQNTNSDLKTFDDMRLTYKQPSHPEDICFENLSLPFSQRLKKQTKTVVLAVGLLLIGGLCFTFLRWIQQKLNDDEDKEDLNITNLMLSLLISVGILVMNLILEIVMAIITKAERHPSHTSYKTSVARKLITLMFLNTAVVPTIVSSYSIEDSQQNENWLHKTGFWLDVYMIVTVNAVFPPLFYYYKFNPLWWVNRLAKRALTTAPVSYMSSFLQHEANEIYTPIEVDFSERYAQVIKTLYVGLYFSPVVPMSLPLSMLGIAFDYLVTKYMLLHKHPKPSYHNEKLGLEMKEWVRYSLAIYAVGVAFFYMKLSGTVLTKMKGIDETYQVLSVVIAGVGFAYLCIPFNYLIKLKLFNRLIEQKIRDNPEYQIPYRQKRLEFNLDFERGNPALRRRAQFTYEEDFRRFQEWRAQGGDEPLIFDRRSELLARYMESARAEDNQDDLY